MKLRLAGLVLAVFLLYAGCNSQKNPIRLFASNSQDSGASFQGEWRELNAELPVALKRGYSFVPIDRTGMDYLAVYESEGICNVYFSASEQNWKKELIYKCETASVPMYSLDKRSISFLDTDHVLCIYPLETKELLRFMQVESYDWLSSGELLIWKESEIFVYDIATNQERRITGAGVFPSVSINKEYLLYTAKDRKTIYILPTDTMQPIAVPVKDGYRATVSRISNDGNYLAVLLDKIDNVYSTDVYLLEISSGKWHPTGYPFGATGALFFLD